MVKLGSCVFLIIISARLVRESAWVSKLLGSSLPSIPLAFGMHPHCTRFASNSDFMRTGCEFDTNRERCAMDPFAVRCPILPARIHGEGDMG